MKVDQKERLRNAVETIKSLEAELRPFIMDAIRFYCEQQEILYKGTGKHTGYGMPTMSAEFKWSIDSDSGNSLEIRWDEYWNYGGHDAGTFCLDWDFILDPKEREKYAADIARECETSIKERAEQALADKLKQYEKLKQELGNAAT